MDSEHWFKAGKIKPANMIGGEIDLREALSRTKKLGKNSWFIAESGDTAYALTRAELLKLQKRLRLKKYSFDPFAMPIERLLKEVGITPSVRVNLPDDPDTDLDRWLRSTQGEDAFRILIVGSPDDEIAVWENPSSTPDVLEVPSDDFPDVPARKPPSERQSGPVRSTTGPPPPVGGPRDGDPFSGDFEEQVDAADDWPGSAAGRSIDFSAAEDWAESTTDVSEGFDPSPDAPAGEPSGSAGLLGGDLPPPGENTGGNGPPPDATYINAVIDRYEGGPLTRDTPYALEFSVDRAPNTSVAAVATAATSEQIRNPGVAITLVVELYGNGFKITPDKTTLELNAQGLSTAKARFAIVPLQAGPAELVALIHKDGNFVQMLKITLDVDQASSPQPNVVSIGRPVAAAAGLKPRRLGLSIVPEGNAFSCLVWGATQRRVTLPINPQELAHAVGLLRQAFMNVVTMTDATGRHPFQTRIDIPRGVSEASLEVLALAGHTLFRTIFFHDAASQDCKDLGKWLIAEANKPGPGFHMQVLGEGFPIPWAALYLTPRWDENALDWQCFLGMKHVIEQMPMGGYGCDTRIVCVPPGLAVALNLNQHIDQQTGTSVVADQAQYWQSRAAGNPVLSLRTCTTSAQLIAALNNAESSDQLIYFYCHAQSVGLVGGGPDASTLAMGNNDIVTLGTLKNMAPTDVVLKGAPLVFINACESGNLSPSFYSGFVPYFMSKGARGVIGTECKMPVLFGAAWAESFFDDFLQGMTLGELVLMKRRDFYLNHNNLLGLLYGVHCNIDTQLVQAEAA